MSTLRALERGGEIVMELAQRWPATLRDALVAYAEIREREVSRLLWNLEQTSEWRAKDISYQCAALSEIVKHLAPEPVEKKGKKAKPSNVVSITPSVARHPRQAQIDLANVMRVDEQAAVYDEVLGALKEKARLSIMVHADVRLNQAMGAEVDELVRTLTRVEEAARQARAAMQQEARGGIPHDPRQVGSMRAGM